MCGGSGNMDPTWPLVHRISAQSVWTTGQMIVISFLI